MTLPVFEHTAPADLSTVLAAVGEGAVPYCGGTELLAAMGMGLLQPERIVSLRKLAELRGIGTADDVLTIGATTTHRDIGRSELVRTAAPLLADVAHRVGNARVRATGTIGGNLAFAEPRSDVSTVLIALGSRVALADASGSREVPLVEFLQGAYETDLRPGELLVRVDVPLDVADVGVYRKVTITERPVVGVAVVRLRDTGSWRVVVGAVGDEPYVAEAAALEAVDAGSIAAQVDVMADLSGSEDYKRHLTEVTVRRCCEAARQKSQEGKA